MILPLRLMTPGDRMRSNKLDESTELLGGMAEFYRGCKKHPTFDSAEPGKYFQKIKKHIELL